MKRTNREKDWPYINALGIKLLKENDLRGCLHLYDAAALSKAVATNPPATRMLEARPALRLAVAGDERLADAIHAETVFWHRLDACRIQLYERALRPYVSAVRKGIARRAMPLAESHEIRMQCADRLLLP